MGIMESRRRILLNSPHIVTPSSAELVSFETDMRALLKGCRVHFSPVQAGEGNPSPANVRPITGWTECEVYMTGNNLVDPDKILNDYYVRGEATASGTKVGSLVPRSGWSVTGFIKVKPSTTYTIEYGFMSASAAGLAFYSEMDFKNVISGISTQTMRKSPYTFTTPEECHYCRFCTADSRGRYMSLTQGDIPPSEQAYSNTTILLDWTDSDGTVYGGYVDLVTGEVWKAWDCQKMDPTWIWNKFEPYSVGDSRHFVQYHSERDLRPRPNDELLCNMFKSISINDRDYPYNNLSAYRTSNGFGFRYDEISTVKDWIDFLTENDVYFAYPLSNYQLVATITPSKLKSLIGTNNIWSTANGNIEASYWTH